MGPGKERRREEQMAEDGGACVLRRLSDSLDRGSQLLSSTVDDVTLPVHH